MKTYLNFTVLFILISTTIGFSQKGHITYEFANGGSISFTKEEYDSLMASRKNPESLVASSEEQEQLLQFYYKKRDKALKNIINQPVTDFDAKDTEGYSHSLAQYRGRVIVLHFWKFEGSAFKSMLPFLNTLSNKYDKDGLVILSLTNIALGDYEKQELKDYPLHFSLIENADRFADDYFKISLMRPCYVVIDKMGIIRYFYDSPLYEQAFSNKNSEGISEFERCIQDLLK